MKKLTNAEEKMLVNWNPDLQGHIHDKGFMYLMLDIYKKKEKEFKKKHGKNVEFK